MESQGRVQGQKFQCDGTLAIGVLLKDAQRQIGLHDREWGQQLAAACALPCCLLVRSDDCGSKRDSSQRLSTLKTEHTKAARSKLAGAQLKLDGELLLFVGGHQTAFSGA